MKIIYKVIHSEMCAGSIRQLSVEIFRDAEEAITFLNTKSDGSSSWWECLVMEERR